MAGPQPSYQQLMAGTQPSYQQLMALGSHVGAPYVGNVGQYPQAALGGGMLGGPSSLVGSSVFFGAAGGSSSRCDDSGSPMSSAPYSPISPAQYNKQQPVRINEASAGSQRWSKQQNLRLVGAWLKHSVDPIHGNNKKSDHYWKQVADEFNKHSCKAERGTRVQCKNHWNRTSTMVAKFNAAVISMRRVYVSGQSEKQLIGVNCKNLPQLGLGLQKPTTFQENLKNLPVHSRTVANSTDWSADHV